MTPPDDTSVRPTAPTRIAVVAPSTDIVGGQSILADWLVSRLGGLEGIEPTLVPINPRLPRFLRWLQRIKYVRTLFTEPWYFVLLLWKLRRADIVHVFSASYLSFVLAPTPAVLVARLYGKRTILHYHSGEARDHLEEWRRTALPVLRMVDRIVVPSDYLVRVFAEFGLEAEAVANFVRSDHVDFHRRERIEPVFLTNRNLEPHYNVSCILRAFDMIQREHPEARLLVAGDGSERGKLERLARELELENVEFLGQVPPDDMGRHYDRADIFLNGSDIDNMPLSILESFGAGLPVVTTDAGGIPDLVADGKNGILVPQDDPEALAEGALRLLDDPALARRLVRAARQQFEESYTWETVRDAWLDVYREVLEDGLRVTMVAPSTDILGGQAVQAARLYRRLEDVEEVEVAMLYVNPRLSPLLRWLQDIKYVRTIVTEVRYVLSLLLRIRRTDVVHIFSASYLSFVLAPTPAILVSRLYGKRTILNYRSGEAEDHLRTWRRTAVPTIRRVDRVVVGSGYLREVFAQFGIDSEAIPNIVEVERYPYRERSQLRPVLLANRNLEPHYNVSCILRAFDMIRREHPEARLLVAGDGSERGKLERLARELELENVEFLGQVPPDDMPHLYDRADIYLNASDVDNMPTSLVEAMAAGLPVVTTSSGGIPYMVTHEETALMVEPDDHEDLARQALRLLSDPDLASSLVERGREECLRNYTWRSVRDAWLDVYRRMGGLAASARAGQEPEEARGSRARRVGSTSPEAVGG